MEGIIGLWGCVDGLRLRALRWGIRLLVWFEWVLAGHDLGCVVAGSGIDNVESLQGSASEFVKWVVEPVSPILARHMDSFSGMLLRYKKLRKELCGMSSVCIQYSICVTEVATKQKRSTYTHSEYHILIASIIYS